MIGTTMTYAIPTLRVRLSSKVNSALRERRFGKDGMHSEHLCGLTKIHIEQGVVYAQVGWGVDGIDIPVSADIEKFVVGFEISGDIPVKVAGLYKLMDKKGARNKTVATARINAVRYGDKDKESEMFVSGKDRKSVLKLYKLIRDGQIRPDIEREEFGQVEGNLNELRRLRRTNKAQAALLETRAGEIITWKAQLQSVSAQLSDIQQTLNTAQ